MIVNIIMKALSAKKYNFRMFNECFTKTSSCRNSSHIMKIVYMIAAWSEENFWKRLCCTKAARGTWAPYFFICFLVSCGHWDIVLLP